MPWVFITDQLHQNDKIVGASGDAVKLWIMSLSWSNDALTDGFVPTSRAGMLAGWAKAPRAVIAECVRRRMWHPADRPCKTCVAQRAEKRADDIPGDGYVIHHYFDFQRTRWAIESDRARMREIGSRGGIAKAAADAGRRGDDPSGTPYRDAIAPRHSATLERDAIAPVVRRDAIAPRHAPVPRTPVPRTKAAESSVPSDASPNARGANGATGSIDPVTRVDGMRHVSGAIARGVVGR